MSLAETFRRHPLWGDRDFVHLWAAQAVSTFGARITREGLPIAAVIGLGASPAQVGLLAALANGPALIVGLAAGGLVDRSPRRVLMIGADLVRGVVLAGLPLAAWLGVLALPHLYLAATLVGAASVLFEIADHAYLPALVARDNLLEANASLTATESVAEIAGPALGGVLFQVLSAPIAIAVNAATYLLSAFALLGVRKRETLAPSNGDRTHLLADVALGFRETLRHRLVRPLFVMAVVQGAAGGAFSALYILYAVRTVELSTSLLGLAIAMGGAGALAGSSLAAWATRRVGYGPALVAASLVAAASACLIPLAPPGTAGFAVLVAAQILGDSFGVASIILAANLRQSVLPNAVLGRVGATFRAVWGGLMVVGALGAGMVAERLGVRATIALAAALNLAGALAVLPLWTVRVLPDAPDGSADDDPAGRQG